MPDVPSTPIEIDEPDAIAAIYSDQFLKGLGDKFDFDLLQPDIADEIRSIGRRYFPAKVSPEEIETRKATRDQYMRLRGDTEKFIQALNEFRDEEIALDLLIAARATGEPWPQTEFPDLTAHERNRTGEPFVRELLRLLELLKRATDFPIEKLAPLPGRRKDEGLAFFVRHVADLWTFEMNRDFTVDYHKGSGLTPAFAFIQALIKPLDREITETQIITAMRAVIAVLNKDNIPTRAE